MLRRGSPRRASPGWRSAIMCASVAAAAVGLSAGSSASAQARGSTTHTAPHAFLASLGKTVMVGSTVPANGDVNPYGIAVVPASAGRLVKGSFLVSNFNDKANVQGTGTTLVEVSPSGADPLRQDCVTACQTALPWRDRAGDWAHHPARGLGRRGQHRRGRPIGCAGERQSCGMPHRPQQRR